MQIRKMIDNGLHDLALERLMASTEVRTSIFAEKASSHFLVCSYRMPGPLTCEDSTLCIEIMFSWYILDSAILCNDIVLLK